jgi:3-oxo-5-alpha-steroid 4-dehydrogenase 1
LVLLPLQTQELPCLLLPIYLAATHPGQLQLRADPRTVTAAASLLHYTNRSLVYPLRLRGGKRTALTVWAMATLFCCCNGFLQVSFSQHHMHRPVPTGVCGTVPGATSIAAS